jgi:hypothetical protein
VSFGRLLLRFIVVPFAIVLAAYAGTLVALVANWGRLATMVGSDPRMSDGHLIVGIVVVMALAFVASITTFSMLLPGLIGVLISETFSIRSWIFHALNGGLSMWVGRATVAYVEQPFEFYDQPLVVLAAGLAAGFVYWAIAGWNAGFMRPPPVPGAVVRR